MNSHDGSNCFCCPDPVGLGIKHRLIVRANDHGDEDLCVILFHRVSWAYVYPSTIDTAYFIFQQKLRLLDN